MSDWSRVVNTTTRNYIRGEEVNILRNRKVFAAMKAKGRITYNWGGDGMNFKVRYRRAPMQGYADSEVLVFPRRDRWKTAELPWRGYALTDSMTKGERLKNKGTAQIIDIYATIAESLMDDAMDHFGDEVYINGDAAGNQKRIHGFESIFSGTDLATYPGLIAASKTYAGLSTVLGNYGGAWLPATTNWPSGTGDSHYDFWTPLQINYTYAGANNPWTDGSTFETNAIQTLRYGIIKSQKNKAKTGRLDIIMLEGEMYRQFLGSLQAIQRLYVQASEANSTLIKLGFTDVQNFDGVDVTWEYGTPLGTGYGFNVDMMELRSMQAQLFVPEGPDYDQASRSWRFSIDMYGNMCINTRYQVKWKNAS
jgi:hypothetical protein